MVPNVKGVMEFWSQGIQNHQSFFFGSKIHNEHNQTFSKISVKLQQISWKVARKLNVPKHESVKNNKTMFLDQYNFFTN